jgi:hypothetical protein
MMGFGAVRCAHERDVCVREGDFGRACFQDSDALCWLGGGAEKCSSVGIAYAIEQLPVCRNYCGMYEVGGFCYAASSCADVVLHVAALEATEE